MTTYYISFIQGLLLSASLIIVIGSQNLFLLRQGLLRQQIFWVATVCVLCDIVLISCGIFGLSELLTAETTLTMLLSVGGILFLAVYCVLAIKRLVTHQSFVSDPVSTTKISVNASNAIIATLAVTLLNPQVYIDTVMIIGSVSAQFSQPNKVAFFIGAISVSLVWFYGLGYGAKRLQPMFEHAIAWIVLDLLTVLVMGWLLIDISRSLINSLSMT